MKYFVSLISVYAIHSVIVFGRETHCSKYHYEEQILSKQIKMEIRLDTLEKKLENLVQYENPVRTSCEDGWIAFQSACYLFGTITVDFNAAKSFCRIYDSHLISIRNSKENNFIKAHIAELKAEKFWIGLTDTITENTWIWIDTNEEAEFLNWGTGQPNQGRDANCVAIFHTFDNNFVDEPCTSRQFRPICKKFKV